jgi:hypothetical protein
VRGEWRTVCVTDPLSFALLPQLVVTHGSGGYIRGSINNSGIPPGTDVQSEALQNRSFALLAQWMEHRLPKSAAGVFV